MKNDKQCRVDFIKKKSKGICMGIILCSYTGAWDKHLTWTIFTDKPPCPLKSQYAYLQAIAILNCLLVKEDPSHSGHEILLTGKKDTNDYTNIE
jgi:hypothetical protein